MCNFALKSNFQSYLGYEFNIDKPEELSLKLDRYVMLYLGLCYHT